MDIIRNEQNYAVAAAATDNTDS